MKGLLGLKLGMTQVYDDQTGKVTPVTLIQVGPCTVLQVKRGAGPDGYDAVQLGFGERRLKTVTKPLQGHFQKASTAPRRFVREVALAPGADPKPGDVLRVSDVFSVGDVVDVIGTSKGRGFAGTHKRHGFSFQPKSHGGMAHRWPGSIGMHTYPGRTIRGKRMAGHYGHARITQKNLRVVEIDTERHLLIVRGAIPGHNEGHVLVAQAKTARRSAQGGA